MKKILILSLITFLLSSNIGYAAKPTTFDFLTFKPKDLQQSFNTSLQEKPSEVDIIFLNTSKNNFSNIAYNISNLFKTDAAYDLKQYTIKGTTNNINNTTTIKVLLTYNTTYQEDLQVKSYVKSRIDLFLKEKPSATTEEKLKFITTEVINLVDYDKTLKNNKTIDAINLKNVTCEGYARLTKHYLDYFNFENKLLKGYGNKEYHMWNTVFIDNQWLHIDNTWIDSLSSKGTLDTTYFLKDSKFMQNTHVWNREETK